MKKLLAIMLALIMVLAMVPALAETSETTEILPDPSSTPTDQPEPTWNLDISKSKSATALDANDQSKVTLSIPSAQENLASDVVFVLDGSSSAESGVVDAALDLLKNLQTAAGSSGATVNVCVVKFKRLANKSGWFDLSTQDADIKEAMKKEYSGGTNIHAGLLAGQAALTEHPNVAPGRKYLILVSDGSTYLYCKEGMWDFNKENIEEGYLPFTRSYNPKENYTPFVGGFWDNSWYEPNNYPEVNVPRPKTTSDVDEWQKYLKDVEERNQKSKGDDYDYHCEYDNNFNQGIPSADFKSQPRVERSANNRDMAFYYADQTWQEMKKAGYRLFSVATKDGSAGEGNADDSHSFMNYLNGGESCNFKEIESEINYAIGAGSMVEDMMGVDFDLVPGTFKLTVGDKPLDSKTEGNVIYFGAKNSNEEISSTNYRFKVEYDSVKDMFNWIINENVSNFAPVKLTYTVKLVNKSTVSGTYNPPTNKYAKLTPKSSNGNLLGKVQEFNIPMVSYTVGGGSSGGGNGGGYYYPTTTPVPVIVIPPKTGDMTIWQSILHFLGIR